MTLRVTRSMLFRSTLWNIQRNSRRLANLQEMLGSGRKINRPSDDPAGILRMLPLKVDLEKLARNKGNIALSKEILNIGTSALQDASSLMIDARGLALQGANGTMSKQDLESLGKQVDQILGQMVSLANTNRAGRYIFGGSKTLTQPFELTDEGGVTRVLYKGDGNTVKVEIGPGLETATNLPGDQVFMSHERGPTTYEGRTGIKAGSGTDNGVGMDFLLVRHTTTHLSGTLHGVTLASTSAAKDTLLGSGHTVTISSGPAVSIDGGPAVSFTPGSGASDVTVKGPKGGEIHLDLSGWDGTVPTSFNLDSSFKLSLDDGKTWEEVDATAAIPSNLQLVDSVTGKVTNVDPRGVYLAGDEVVMYEGTFDAFQSLIALRDTLDNTHDFSGPRQKEILRKLVGQLDEAHDGILEALRTLGGRIQKMELVRGRVEDMEVSLTDALGDVRDIDLADTIMKMTQQETLFQSSLAVGARVVQPTLLDFLR